jgi:ligand-binding SRPBCC domain-containing protein
MTVLLLALTAALTAAGPDQTFETQQISQQDFYAAVWEKPPSTPDWVARHNMSATEYQQEFDDLSQQGYRLVEISGYGLAGQDFYAAIWEKRSGPDWTARHNMTATQYQQTFDDLTQQGYRLVEISGYEVGGQARFAAIWEKSSGVAWRANHGLTNAEYQRAFKRQTGLGYRLVDVSGYSMGGQDFYAAIWEKRSGPDWVARHDMTSTEYQQEFDRLARQGYHLVELSGYGVDDDDFYAAIWEEGAAPDWTARHDMTATEYQQTFDDLNLQGYRLVEISGYSVRQLSSN